MLKQEKSKLLRNFMLFNDLRDEELEAIADYLELKSHDRGRILFLQNEPINKLFFLLEGQVKVYRTNFDGKEQIINLLQAGDMFPHQGFFRESQYPANAEVIEDAQLMTIDLKDFEPFILLYPTISEKIYKMLGELISDLQNRLEAKILYTANEQIMKQLARLTRLYGERINEAEFKIKVQFTNQELANMIGTSRETVSRTLSLLRQDGLLRSDQDQAYIVHYEGLIKKFSE